MGRKTNYRQNYQFKENLLINNLTYIDYLDRFKKIALSLFEWVNLPPSMNSMWLEKCLFYNGQAAILKDKELGFINTNCASNGYINIYGLPSSLNCYSFEYQSSRKLYTGLKPSLTSKQKEYMETNEAILVMNNWDRTPTIGSMELFALRLYEAERTADVNIKAQKTPVMIVVDEKQRILMENLYSQYDGNKPYIFGDKDQLSENLLRSVNTQAPFIANDIMTYKKEIWNEALTFLGINNIMVDKKERLITDEANSNNELINLNLQASLGPRKEACRQFNEKFNFTGTDKEIDVRVRSDLHNIIKQAESIVSDYDNLEDIKEEVT